jgi:hypothetical protein
MRRVTLLAVATLLGCAGPLIEPIGPGRYKVRDPSRVDILVEAPKLCGVGVRYSYDSSRKHDFTQTSTVATTRYWSEGILVCDPEAAARWSSPPQPAP